MLHRSAIGLLFIVHQTAAATPRPRPCPHGTQPSPANRTACSPCKEGLTSPQGRSCERCPSGKVISQVYAAGCSAGALSVCEFCPPGVAPNKDNTECVCLPNSFSLRGDEVCHACPEHVFCPGGAIGHAPMYAHRDWWIDELALIRAHGAWLNCTSQHDTKVPNSPRPSPPRGSPCE